MRRRRGEAADGDGEVRGRGRGKASVLTRGVEAVFEFVKLAEFEILFVVFFLAAFLFIKDLTSRPHYNQILVKNPEDDDFWPFSGFRREGPVD
ncbi:GRIP/coiled-coil protein [Wolffia australiana]